MTWAASLPGWHAAGNGAVLALTCTSGALGSALVACLGYLYRARPHTLARLGLAYEVGCCVLIAVGENWTPWPADQLVRGILWEPLVIVAFSLTVPMSPRSTLVAGTLGASMGPLAFVIVPIVRGTELSPPFVAALLFLPSYLGAALAYVLSRVVHGLGQQVQVAQLLGGYQLERLLGRGGMGEVWLARHRFLARPAAIKIIRSDVLAEQGPASSLTMRRFEREAQATAALESPHTIEIYDCGVAPDGTFYYVMELLDGLDAESLVRRFGPMPAPRVVHLLRQACRSLAEAHERRLVHRDIKPANLYVCRQGLDVDFVKVLDFGLVKAISEVDATALARGARSTVGTVCGTPAYMAPELAVGEQLGPSVDIYALGCVAYWLLTGTLVFEASSPIAMLRRHVEAIPEPPSIRTEAEIPADLERIVMQCLEKDPARRPTSALALDAMLADSSAASELDADEVRGWWERHLPSSARSSRLSF